MIKRRQSTITFLIILHFFSILVLLFGIRQPLNVYDEGIILVGAARVQMNELPYLDFFSLYSPGQYFVISTLFKIFGSYILVERLYDILIRAFLATLIFYLVDRFATRSYAYFSWLSSLLWLGYFSFFGYPVFPALLFFLLSALLLYESLLKSGKMYLSSMGGALLACVTIFRHDFGFYFFCATCLWILSLLTVYRNSEGVNIKKVIYGFTAYVLTIIIILLSLVLLSIHFIKFENLWRNLIELPIIVIPEYRAIPFPLPVANFLLVIKGQMSISAYLISQIERFQYYIPIGIILFAIIRLLYERQIDKTSEGKTVFVVFLVLASVISFNQARVRSDLIHFSHFVLFSLIIFPIVWSETRINVPLFWSRCIKLFIITIFICLHLKPFYHLGQNINGIMTPPQGFVDGDMNAKFIYVDENQNNASRYLNSVVRTSEFVYVGNERHDVTYINDVSLYFIGQFKCPVYYHELHPGITTTDSIQKRMIGDLVKNNVTRIVKVELLDKKINEPAIFSKIGSKLLDEFITTNFHRDTSFGNYTILVRK